MFRIGFGMDSHHFEENGTRKSLKLGGVVVPDCIGLRGKSDADVVLHALFNAISQSLGRRSIGYYCEPMSEQKGIVSSEEYLKLPLNWLDEEGFFICNVGITIECQTPQIEPLSEEMRSKLASLLNVKEDQIGINATSGEQLTPFGLGKGIQAFAIVLVAKR